VVADSLHAGPEHQKDSIASTEGLST
jgi:hypothetical protein